DLLRPRGHLAPAGAGRLRAPRHPLLHPQVRAQHVRRVSRRRRPRARERVMTTFSEQYLAETIAILQAIDLAEVEKLATGLRDVRDGGGRLFVLGVGGSAAHAGHAVNDLRKICAVEAYAPTDNVAELTARINDEGWDT